MSTEPILLALACVIVLGVGAQWLAWFLRLPSILLLLAVGFAAGATGLLDPDEQFGELVLPVVSLSVALILYEGGLTLRFRELHDVGGVIWRLVTVGAAVTWAVAALGAWLLFDLSPSIAVLLGAVLVVTGPTVIVPMLLHLRPRGPAGNVLKWEGIVIDPIGALLAVLVFEAIIAVDPGEATGEIALGVVRTIFFGGTLGAGAGFLLAGILRAFAVPDFLENAVSVMLVVAVYAVSEMLQHESGLLATTVMGVVLANQRLVDVHHIVEFKEHLRVLLISGLFIVLAARVRPADLAAVGFAAGGFVALLVLVARPLSVLLSSVGSPLSWRERSLLASIAPRGIVAAAVSSVFAIRLQAAGFEDASALVPLTFSVIVGTVVIYGLVGPFVARRTGIAEPNPQGVLLVGAQRWARELARVLDAVGVRCMLVDTNRRNVAAARMEGLDAHVESILAEHALEEMDLGGLGRIIAVTSNDWVNALATKRATRIFNRANVYQLPSGEKRESHKASHRHLHGRWLFNEAATYEWIDDRVTAGWQFKATSLTDAFTFADFRATYGDEAPVLFMHDGDRILTVVTAGSTPDPKPGQTVIALVPPEGAGSGEETKARSDEGEAEYR